MKKVAILGLLSLVVSNLAFAGSFPEDVARELAETCSKSVPSSAFGGCVYRGHRYLADIKLRLDLCLRRSWDVTGDLKACEGDAAHAIVLAIHGVDAPHDLLPTLSGLIELTHGNHRAMKFSSSVSRMMGASRLISYGSTCFVEK